MPSYDAQLDDLDAWAKEYLAFDEPLPTTVRDSVSTPEVSEFIYLFGKGKAFRLEGEIQLTDTPITNAKLYIYHPGSGRSLLATIKDKDITNGVMVDFKTPAADGIFKLYIQIVNNSKQVCGYISTTGTVTEDLYLCPITPPEPTS